MQKIVTVFIALFACSSLFAQIDTTSFPDERQALRRLTYNAKPVTSMDCNNFITVSPEGDISFSFKECKTTQIKQKAAFKFIAPMPCHEFIGIYDGNTAVADFLANVYCQSMVRMNNKVRWLEFIIKVRQAGVL